MDCEGDDGWWLQCVNSLHSIDGIVMVICL